MGHVLLLTDSLAQLVPAVCHDDTAESEESYWAETLGGQVAL